MSLTQVKVQVSLLPVHLHCFSTLSQLAPSRLISVVQLGTIQDHMCGSLSMKMAKAEGFEMSGPDGEDPRSLAWMHASGVGR